jgi:Sphingosine kinase and enzymes related to eukaryotic diacylglycerol kinase
VRVLRRAQPVDVTIRNRRATVWSLFIGVNRNREGSVTPLQRMRLDDGQLDVRILHAGPRARAVGSLVFGRRGSDVLRRLRVPGTSKIEQFATDEVTVVVRPRQGRPPGLAHDGEVWLDAAGGPAPEGGYACRVRNIPRGLRVYSPTR